MVIAIVDDDDAIRGALQDMMEQAGLPAQGFASAEDFLQSGQECRTVCLIADIRMPGMSGLELQAQLNKEHPKIPVIIITAHGDEQIRLQALRAGAIKYLDKPFDDDVLLETVRAVLGSCATR